jgi:hypothetical protein
LTNNRYSSDVIAIACAEVLAGLPDLPSDNALPRWLAEVAGYPVAELAAHRLRFDVDDRSTSSCSAGLGRRRRSVSRPASTRAGSRPPWGPWRRRRDPSAELLVAGRASSASLTWLERRTAARVRALIEERGLRAAALAASSSAPAQPRPPASVLGALLERDGPEALGSWVARLADGALVDSRVLLAHRLGADERRWPAAEDRYASDLLLHERVADPWLRALTRSALEAPVPIALGGHTLVGPGIRLALR